MGKRKGMGKFIAGAAIGAGVALLFAPQEGSKTRKQLKIKLDEFGKKIKDINPGEVKDNIEKKIAEIKADLQDLDKEKVLEYAKLKANNIVKKTDELVKLAVKKGTPVVKKTANELRLKAIDVLEETAHRLENADPNKKTSETPKKPKTKKKAKKA